jgi:hypothetical protein
VKILSKNKSVQQATSDIFTQTLTLATTKKNYVGNRKYGRWVNDRKRKRGERGIREGSFKECIN